MKFDGSISISVGESRKDIHWKQKSLIWSAFTKELQTPIRTHETFEEYKSLPKARRDELKDVGGYVGGVLVGERRKAGAVRSRSLVTLDLDAVQDDPWEIVHWILSCAAVLYSTHSHSSEKPRYRLILPLARSVSAEEYEPLARRIAQEIGIDACDDTTFEPSRLMYWPSASKDGDYRFELSDAPWLNPDEWLAKYENWKNPQEWPVSSRVGKSLHKALTKQEDPLEKKGVVGAFCRAYSMQEALETFLPEVYAPGDGNRYTYIKGSTAAGLVIYDDKFAYSHHGSDPASGKLCNAFDLVRIHKFGALDEDSEETGVKAPSFKAMNDFALSLDPVRRALVDTAFAEPVIEETEDWTTKLELTSSGAIKQTVSNVALIVKNDERLKKKLAYDEFRERIVVLDDLPWMKREKRSHPAWQDTDDAGLRGYIEQLYKIDSQSKIRDGLDVALLTERVHPVRQYLEALTWDRQPRLDALLYTYFQAEESDYIRAVTRKALIGAVARIEEPGCKHDHMLVLIGPQGCGKSTFLAQLGRDWFSDSLYTLNGKDAYEQLQGYWILEMSEMAATRKAELEQIKQFISKQTDSYRAAYAKRTVEHPRQCAFFGTTNDAEFLHDPTGARRFWPVEVQAPATRLKLEVDQIWAEAMTAYKAGETWYLPPEMEREARKHQKAHTEISGKAGIIERWLERDLPADWETRDLETRRFYFAESDFSENKELQPRKRVCALEIWQELFNGDPKQFSAQQAREINAVLRSLDDWEAKTKIDCGPLYGYQRGFVRK